MARMERKVMMQGAKIGLSITLFTLALLSCQTGNNRRIINGYVFEANTSNPLFQATILLKHKDSLKNEMHYLKGTTSDSTGYFEIEIEGNLNEQMLFVGYVGYKVLKIFDLKKTINENRFYLEESSLGHIELPVNN